MLAEGTGGSKAGSGLTQELELHRLGGKSQGSYEGALGFLGNSLAVPQKMSPGVTLWSVLGHRVSQQDEKPCSSLHSTLF